MAGEPSRVTKMEVPGGPATDVDGLDTDVEPGATSGESRPGVVGVGPGTTFMENRLGVGGGGPGPTSIESRPGVVGV